MTNQNKWQFWIDRGGTFTDVLAKNPEGRIRAYKLLSDNPECYSDAAIEGIRQALNLKSSDSLSDQPIHSVKMGTTVATNALLEHLGEPTVFVATQGFGDALRIGHQNRPRLFDLHIQLPKPLYERVIEVEERVDVNGQVITPLNIEAAKHDLMRAYNEGFRAVAIVLMHSYRFHEHEIRLADCARDIGFQQISLSHRVSPLMRYINRGNTTVIDAYLSPIIRKYVDGVAAILKNTELYFMQSNGGLAEAHSFTGRNSILSGPAAGVIGAIKTGTAAGFEKIISFDMGGTSTDVAHYSGELERTETLDIAGMRLQAPMMKMNTIAAGGGSILRFHQGRFRVGPASAGANPGPSCYRRGGPLTVTDANVMLGRIQADYFPRLFGPDANQSIDIDSVKENFKALQEKIYKKTGDVMSVEQIADGFLKIAVHNMANAIKKISVERGYDVTQYVLSCFGGAGSQHACDIADVLGIKTILIHPFSGVLSAYGMGLAEVRVMKERAVESAFNKKTHASLLKMLDGLREAGEKEIAQQGVSESQIITEKKVQLRYHGTNTTLNLYYNESFSEMQHAFESQYLKEFGYVMSEKEITIESISVEVIGRLEHPTPKQSTISQRHSLKPREYVEAFFNDEMHKTPLYARDDLLQENAVEGPAIITENNSTIVVVPGWEAILQTNSDLILKRQQPIIEKEEVSTNVDPVMLELFHNLLMSIAEQMGTVLAKTAYSVNIKERLDFSCAIFDEQGHLVANAPHIPVHLGSMSESVQAIIRKRGDTIQSGDVYMLNDPYHGGTHLPDITLITPVFIEAEDRPVFFVASRAHHADIGGTTPGSIPASSQRIEEEGVLIDNFLLVKNGVFQEAALNELLTSSPYPVRNIQQNIADLKAQIAANQKGHFELLNIIGQYTLPVITAYMQHIQNNAEACVREVIDQLSDGQFRYEMDNGAQIAVHVRKNAEKREAIIDFTGSSSQRANNFNAPKAVCYAAVLYVFRTIIKTDIPLNYGCFKPLTIIIPEDSMLNPRYPAAIVAGNVETSQCIVDTLYGALNVMAASQGTMNNFTFGNEKYQYYETICGGSGAGPGFHGTSAVHTHMTNSLLTDPEILEFRFPVMIDSFSLRSKSGGKGKWHGGDGVIRRIRFLETMDASIVSNRRKIPPYGMAGGQPAMPGKNSVQRSNGATETLDSTAEIRLYPGDIFIIETPGGGGFEA